MKRKASQAPGNEPVAKLSKESSDSIEDQVPDSETGSDIAKPLASEPARGSSSRQRKAPAWLASYVTDGSTVKEVAEPKVPPVKKKSSKPAKPVENDQQDASDDQPSLRRVSTLKLEESPPQPSKTKSLQKSVQITHSPSLVKKDTEILSPSGSDSGDSFPDLKPAVKGVSKKPSVQKYPNRSSSSSSTSSSNTASSANQASQKLLAKKAPSKRNITSKSSIRVHGVDAGDFSSVMEVCDTKNALVNKAVDTSGPGAEAASSAGGKLEKPSMLEVVICISTSGAMRDYLTVLQDKTRDLVWRLQSHIPNLRIGVLAHTQGGIHDDKPGSSSPALDHNYIRTGGHSGTKWLDLGASFSQICAFVDSLVPEATVYPDYVQDNLEMALWKLQRCMSWSSCSYRTVMMVGRGRPNRTSFYLQREHWRGWIRSALEIGPKAEIPIIDWELEAKLLAQMGIHVFAMQAVSAQSSLEDEEDEGSTFFRRVAEITNSVHIKLTDASKLVDIMVGVCCACYGPDLLQEHRETLRDENDGVLPQQLKDIFIALQLHSNRRSLSTIPSFVGDVSALQQQLAKAEANGNISSSGEDEASGDEEEQMAETKPPNIKKESGMASNTKGGAVAKAAMKAQKAGKVKAEAKPVGAQGKAQKATKKDASNVVKSAQKATKKDASNVVKSGRVVKGKKVAASETNKTIKKAVKIVKAAKVGQKNAASTAANKVQTQVTDSADNKKHDTNAKSSSSSNNQKTGVTGKKAVEVKSNSAKAKSSSAVIKAATQKNTRVRGKVVPKAGASTPKDSKTVDNTNSKTDNNLEVVDSPNHANKAASAVNPASNRSQTRPNKATVQSSVAGRTANKSNTRLNKSLSANKKTPATANKLNNTSSKGSTAVNIKEKPNNNVKATREVGRRTVTKPQAKNAKGAATKMQAGSTTSTGASVVTRKVLRAKK